jgi:hypothetical protein
MEAGMGCWSLVSPLHALWDSVLVVKMSNGTRTNCERRATQGDNRSKTSCSTGHFQCRRPVWRALIMRMARGQIRPHRQCRRVPIERLNLRFLSHPQHVLGTIHTEGRDTGAFRSNLLLELEVRYKRRLRSLSAPNSSARQLATAQLPWPRCSLAWVADVWRQPWTCSRSYYSSV